MSVLSRVPFGALPEEGAMFALQEALIGRAWCPWFHAPPLERRKSLMTFTEAAAQVLRLVGKPLHHKEITDVAIEQHLLSHVGKSPDVTMGARLAALVKKGDKENPLVRVKPGVFALREWDQDTIEKGLKDRTPALEKLSGQDIDFGSEQEISGASHVSLDEFAEEGEPVPPNAAERERAELA